MNYMTHTPLQAERKIGWFKSVDLIQIDWYESFDTSHLIQSSRIKETGKEVQYLLNKFRCSLFIIILFEINRTKMVKFRSKQQLFVSQIQL